MKILITSSLFHPEIAEPAPYVKKISELLKKNNEIKIISYSNILNNREENLFFVKKSDFLVLRLLKFLRVILKNSKNIDVIYTQTGIASALPSIIAGKIKKIPVILRFFEDEAYEREEKIKNKNIKIKIILFLQKFILRKAEMIITPSSYFKEKIINQYKIKENKIAVNYDFLNKKINLPFEATKDQKLIYINADNSSKKETENIINYFRKNYKIIIKGVKEKNLKNKNIKYINNISKAEDYYYKSKAKFYIQLKSNKNTINEIMEAVSLNTFTIAFKTDQNEELFNKIKFGLLIKKVEEFKNLDLEQDKLNIKKIDELFSDKNHTKNLIKTFNEVIS
jgi:hypothetical protein